MIRRIISISLFLLYSFVLPCSAIEAGDYLSCEGTSGAISNPQVSFVNGTITESKSDVQGSIYVDDNEVVVEGIFLMSGRYTICQKNAQMLWFSPAGRGHFCSIDDTFDDLGVINEVKGEVRYRVGKFLVILNCKKTRRVWHARG